MIGNPGVGKSTLLNSLIKKIKFKSGISIGGGLTQVVQYVSHGSINYGDTPGLCDMELKEQAANEIEKALKRGGEFKILFVMTIESGRVRPEDFLTIETVLSNIDVEVNYGIVINKVTGPFMELVEEDENVKNKLYGYFKSLIRPPEDIIFIRKHNDLEDKKDKLVKPDTELLKLLERMKSTCINPTQVRRMIIKRTQQKKIIERSESAMKSWELKYTEIKALELVDDEDGVSEDDQDIVEERKATKKRRHSEVTSIKGRRYQINNGRKFHCIHCHHFDDGNKKFRNEYKINQLC